MKKILCILLILSSSLGIAFGQVTEFKRYDGPQSTFPLSANTKVDQSFSIPIYYGPAPREYHIVGYVIEHGNQTGTKELDTKTALRSMARAAKIHGADAFILRPLNDRLRAMVWGSRPAVFAWGIAIKWGPAPL